jgi:hypothetical protein
MWLLEKIDLGGYWIFNARDCALSSHDGCNREVNVPLAAFAFFAQPPAA